MPSSDLPAEVTRLERSIEANERLLEYLRSGPLHLTMESYLCLTGILTRAGWSHDGEMWCKNERSLGLLDAAQAALAGQIAADKERILRQTVRHYRG